MTGKGGAGIARRRAARKDGRVRKDGVWLAIETSVRSATVAVGDASGVLASEAFESDRSHNSVLFGPLARVLEPVDVARLAVVLVGTGPGSYSGTRVGIAAGQGVAIIAACPAVGVPSMLATPEARAGGVSLAVGDARRGGWWLARVEEGRVTAPPAIMAHEAFAREVAAAVAAGLPVVAFDPVERLRLDPGVAARLVPARPSARILLEWWARRGDGERAAFAAEALQPVYLRPPHVTRAKDGHPLLRDPLS